MCGRFTQQRPTSEMALPQYRENDRNRCYWCKHTLFDACARAEDRGQIEN